MNRPDAWLALVLQTMSEAELRKEIANAENSAEERAQMRAELESRQARKRGRN